MWRKFLLLFYTMIHLKPIQLVYQLWYRLKSKWPIKPNYGNSYDSVAKLQWVDGIFNLQTYIGEKNFRFLNIEHQFKPSIDWNFNLHKKLWTYNLNYFDFLNQETITKADGLFLMEQFIKDYNSLEDGKDPYPTSLRLINWIKFIAKHQINDTQVFEVLREDANRLCKNLEYHLLGNHLLENGFALWFASYLFQDKILLQKSTSILYKQLKEQVLQDGGHFELSPMYHQLMLYRVLDCIRLAELNPFADARIIYFLRKKASKMASWLQNMTFKGGQIPLFNDSANNINPNSESIFHYVNALKIKSVDIALSASGYRKLLGKNYQLIADVGSVGPLYQAGHAHADTFNFELYVNQKPIIVDSGTSTYNIGSTRSLERSTAAHNTVTVNNSNSSQVWSGFRVAKRAHITGIVMQAGILTATHNGFKQFGVAHQRSWKYTTNEIIIKDKLIGKKTKGKAFFHLHSSVKQPLMKENKVILESSGVIFDFENESNIEIQEYKLSKGFNKRILAYKIVITFNQNLKTKIKFN